MSDYSNYIIYAILVFILFPHLTNLILKAVGWYVELYKFLRYLHRSAKDKDRNDEMGYQGAYRNKKYDDEDALQAFIRVSNKAAGLDRREPPPPEPAEEEVAPKEGEYWMDRLGQVHGPLAYNLDHFWTREGNPRPLICGDSTWRKDGRSNINGEGRSCFDLRKKVDAPVPAPADDSRGDAPADLGKS